MSFDWLFLVEISLAGLGTGALYALTGLAFVILYKATRVVNLAIGEMLMIGAYVFFAFAAGMALPIWVAIVAAIVAGGLLGAVVERTMIRPMLGESPISVFMVTVGLGSILVGLVELIWTADPRRLPEFMPTDAIFLGDAYISAGPQHLGEVQVFLPLGVHRRCGLGAVSGAVHLVPGQGVERHAEEARVESVVEVPGHLPELRLGGTHEFVERTAEAHHRGPHRRVAEQRGDVGAQRQ